jgi:hypothetical protein
MVDPVKVILPLIPS